MKIATEAKSRRQKSIVYITIVLIPCKYAPKRIWVIQIATHESIFKFTSYIHPWKCNQWLFFCQNKLHAYDNASRDSNRVFDQFYTECKHINCPNKNYPNLAGIEKNNCYKKGSNHIEFCGREYNDTRYNDII